MRLEDVIKGIDRDIAADEQHISTLKDKKLLFEKIKDQCPGAHLEGRALCLPNIWNSITCMRIETKRKYYSATSIFVKFRLNEKQLIEGMKVYTLPFENEIAEIRHVYGVTRSKEILIRDYKALIPDNCPRRNAFIKRIKLYLVGRIHREGLIMNEKSSDREEFMKLILLK